jgi:cytochrome c553
MKQSQLLQTMLRTAGIGAIATMSVVSVDALAGIKDTKHNLSTSQTTAAFNQVTAGTAEICVFCHTPHGSDTSAPVPLWNKKLDATGFTTYKQLGTSTLDAGTVATGSVSLACLSCHDGAQAMDNMINKPGSGGYLADGGGTAGANYTWQTGGTANTDGQLIAGITQIGKDLRNDHPIGIEYCGGFTTAGDRTTCRDKDFVTASNSASNATSTASSVYWWVDTTGTGTAGDGAANTRGKKDMVLYTRDFGSSSFRPSVECASCHDPHEQTKNSGEVAFLRVSQSGSGVCLACHDK